MKRLLIGDSREELLSTLEVILRHWGYRVLVSSRPAQLEDLLRETSPNLLVMGARLLMEQESSLARAVNHHVRQAGCPLIVLQEEQVTVHPAVPHETLGVPPDPFSLFSLIQKHLEKHPRRNMRLAIQLPGMLCTGEVCHLAEVLSLSSNGLFVKAGFRPAEGELLRVFFPLLGMKQELELDCRILYRVEPGPGNNYFQGFGLEFTGLAEEARQALQAFLEHRFIGDLAARPGGERLRLASTKKPLDDGCPTTLRLNPA
jgi:hypothetical protein